jgi:hypothetical protein
MAEGVNVWGQLAMGAPGGVVFLHSSAEEGEWPVNCEHWSWSKSTGMKNDEYLLTAEKVE